MKTEHLPGIEPARTKRERQADEMWDAWVEHWMPGGVPNSPKSPIRAQLNRQVQDLKDMGAKPSDIRSRVAAWPVKFPDTTCTPEGVCKHWNVLGDVGKTINKTVQWGTGGDGPLHMYSRAVDDHLNYLRVRCADNANDARRIWMDFVISLRLWVKKRYGNNRTKIWDAIREALLPKFDIATHGMTDEIYIGGVYKLFKAAQKNGEDTGIEEPPELPKPYYGEDGEAEDAAPDYSGLLKRVDG